MLSIKPTLIAVSILSPVIINILNLAYCKFLIFFNVSYLRGELQIKNPAKSNSFYTSFLYCYLFGFSFTYLITLDAKAKSLYPCLV